MRNKIIMDNSLTSDILVSVEPEGFSLNLNPGKSITISENYVNEPLTIRFCTTQDGKLAIALWPGDGDINVISEA